MKACDKPRRLGLQAGLCFMAVAGVASIIAAEKPGADSSSSGQNPWFDARLRNFFATKSGQARTLLGNDQTDAEVWTYFKAGSRGDWTTMTNLYSALRRHARQFDATAPNAKLDAVWSPIVETYLAWDAFSSWKEKYVLAYGSNIIKSIPPNSVYFGGTDVGRGLITAMSESHEDAKPFYTITQNQLADKTYLDYLQAMYGAHLYIPTSDDLQTSFQEYLTDAKRRLSENKLKPGEDVKIVDDRIQASGPISVMSINGLVAKVIFDHNTNREFYVEESYPIDWMYPHLSPDGLVMKLNRRPLPFLSGNMVQLDHDYWSNYTRPLIGDWLGYDTSVSNVAKFVEKIYLNHDFAGFRGDPRFVEDDSAQKTLSKDRSSIGGLYAWRAAHAGTSEEKTRMTREADFAFRQAYVLCPLSPEVLARYSELLKDSHHVADARLLLKTALKLNPKSEDAKYYLEKLEDPKSQN